MLRLARQTRATMRRYEESLAQLDMALASAPLGFAFFDRDLRFVRVNDYLSRHDSVPVAEHVGRTVREVSPTIADQVEPILHRVLETGEPLIGTENSAEWPPGSGDIHYWMVNGYPVRTPEGALQGVGLLVIDITEQKRVQEALRQRTAELDAVFHALPDLYFRVSADGTYLDVRAGKPSDLYAPSEQLLGRRIRDMLPSEAARRVDQAIHDALTTGQVITVEYPLTIEGEERIFEGRVSPLTRDQVVIVARNVTNRKRTEDALRLLSEVGRLISVGIEVDEMLAGVARAAVPVLGDWCLTYVVEAGGALRRVAVVAADESQADLAQQLMGFPSPQPEKLQPVLDALRDRRVRVLNQPPDWGMVGAATSPEHLAVLTQMGVRAAIVMPLGARGRLLGLAICALSRPGRTYDERYAALAEEVASRVAVALDNARLYREACAANAAKDQFLAVLSHELRNPLAPILAGVEVLRRAAPDDPRIQRTVAIIDRNVKLQARLVSDLLDLSRIHRGKLELQRAAVTLDAVVEAAVQTLQPDATNAGLTITVNAPPGLWVFGDPDRLQQVVMNLLSNAIKFTPAGGRITVTVRECGEAEKREGMAPAEGEASGAAAEVSPYPPALRKGCIIVEDTGIGISQDLLPNLFTMFQQGEVAGRRAAGLGIGLALVRSITELHGGRVWAESEGPGKGSRFTVELPLIAPPEGVPAPPKATAAGARVLLVEDNPDTRALLAEGLASQGCRVRAVATGEEALEALAQEVPDAIVADIGLPGMDGYELIRRVRRLPQAAQVTAFAVTAYGRSEDAERARQAGYTSHLTKPVDVAALAQRIREALQGSRGTPGS